MRITVLRGFAIPLILSATLISCAGMGIQTDWQKAEARAAAYLASHPTLDAETASSIRELTLKRGMTMDEVIAAWGKPAVVQSYEGGRMQFWFFGCDTLHSCATPEKPSEPDQRYVDRATLVGGKLTDWVE